MRFFHPPNKVRVPVTTGSPALFLRRAFTLIELLVVIAIIAILVGLTTPALLKLRQRARAVACGETLHGLGLGLKSYLAENNDILPLAAQMPSVNAPIPPLPTVLAAQINRPDAWHCPADVNGYTQFANGTTYASFFAGEGTSYEFNMGLGGKKVEAWFLHSMLGDLRTFVLADFDSFHDKKGAVHAKDVLFSDGHVGTVDEITNALGLPASP